MELLDYKYLVSKYLPTSLFNKRPPELSEFINCPIQITALPFYFNISLVDSPTTANL